MSYIEYQDENGTYRITREGEDAPVVLDSVIEDMIIPILLAAGYNRKSIDAYYCEEPDV